MTISPDQILLWRLGFFEINATLLNTWIIMALLGILSWFATRRLTHSVEIPRWQVLLEVLLLGLERQIRDISQQEPGRYLPFIGTLFLFIALSNLLAVVPGFLPPTASLSTTTALAISVLVAVPIYGIAGAGLGGYLAKYLRPSPFMLPFNVMGEISRTVALAVRLYGNIMSGMVIGAILLGIAPYLFPVLLQLLGLLTGLIQAYIFSVLAMVYIASATGSGEETSDTAKGTDKKE